MESTNNIKQGAIPNVPAGEIAKKYYSLPEDAKLRDVILHVRADEVSSPPPHYAIPPRLFWPLLTPTLARNSPRRFFFFETTKCMHRDFNHHLSDLYDAKEEDEFPTKMGEEVEGKPSEAKEGASSGVGRASVVMAASGKKTGPDGAQ